MHTPLRRFATQLLDLVFPAKRRTATVAELGYEDVAALLAPKCFELEGTSVLGLLPYDHETVRDLVWALKYDACRHAAELSGAVLADALLEELSEAVLFGESVSLVPLPLSRERLATRGYNQSLWLAEALVQRAGSANLRLEQTLVRTRDTRPQTALSREERLRNVSGAFRVPPTHAVKNKRCIVLDDVVTTGSTLREAQRTLRAAGAASVTCLALAYADGTPRALLFSNSQSS